MKLYELGTGEPVQVLVKVENASAEYDSTVAFGKEGILLIEPIRYDGKIINFSGDKVHISVIYMEDIPLGNNEIKILNRISSSYMAQCFKFK